MTGCCASPDKKPDAHQHASTKYRPRTDSCCSPSPVSTATLQPLAATAREGDQLKTPIRILQMDCPTEEALLRKQLVSMPGVSGLEFNLMQRVLTVTHAEDALPAVLSAIRAIGFEPETITRKGPPPDAQEPHAAWRPLSVAGGLALLSEGLSWWGSHTILAALLALTAILLSGLTTYRKGWVAIRLGNLNINALMSIAVTGAALLGEWPEAAMVMVLFTLAERIEARSLDRARQAIRSLMQLSPDRVMARQADNSWMPVAVEQVAVGTMVRVRPGERIGLDGEIVRGTTSINQAPITGESLPVDKQPGDAVFAGTINETAEIEYKVTTLASQSTLARIIHAVEEAQGVKAPTQRFVDQFAKWYTPVVFLLALLIAVLPPLWTGGGWYEWIYRALVLLVIACPCALVISTPVTIVSGLATAARQGILIKGGVYLETGRKLTAIALDKTGTLTTGSPTLTDAQVWMSAKREDVMPVAAGLAMRSDHPVSRAIAEGLALSPDPLSAFTGIRAMPGQGIEGCLNGQEYALGNHSLVVARGLATPALDEKVASLESKGQTVVLLMDASQVLAWFTVADTIKPGTRTAIQQLSALGIRTLMLSGDNQHTADAIARQAGVAEAKGGLLPDDKRRIVATWRQQGCIGMVGDGINDAPALATADIGFAMGAIGTDTAIETADVALMDDDLQKLPVFIRLSRQTHRILLQNICLALLIKAVFLGLTLTGHGAMWMAVFADVGASLLVVGNGLRLLRIR